MMVDINLAVMGTAAAFSVVSAGCVFWARYNEREAVKDRDEWYGAYYDKVPKQKAIIKDLCATIRNVERSLEFLDARVRRALTQAENHPNTRPGKIVDILRGLEPWKGPDMADTMRHMLSATPAPGNDMVPMHDPLKRDYLIGDRVRFHNVGNPGVYELQDRHTWKLVDLEPRKGAVASAQADQKRTNASHSDQLSAMNGMADSAYASIVGKARS